MSEPFIGEIRLVAFDFAPQGNAHWAVCDGAELQINDYAALYSLMGDTFGGNGNATFNLPDLRGRTPVHFNFQRDSMSPNTIPYILTGEKRGAEEVALLPGQVPAHTHVALGSTTSTGDSQGRSPGNSILRAANLSTTRPYSTDASDGALVSSRQTFVKPAGSGADSGLPHPNMQPYQVVNAIIALTGVLPRRTGAGGALGVFQELPNGAVHPVFVPAANTYFEKRAFLRNDSVDTLRIPAIWPENADNVDVTITSEDEYLSPGDVTELIMSISPRSRNAFRFDVSIRMRRIYLYQGYEGADVDPTFIQTFSVNGTVDAMSVFSATGPQIFDKMDVQQGRNTPSDKPQEFEFRVVNTLADPANTLKLGKPELPGTNDENMISQTVSKYTETPLAHKEMGSVVIEYRPEPNARFRFKVELPAEVNGVPENDPFSFFVTGHSLPMSTQIGGPEASAPLSSQAPVPASTQMERPEAPAPLPSQTPVPDAGQSVAKSDLKLSDQPPKLLILAQLENGGSFPQRAGLANHSHSFDLTMMSLGVLPVGLNVPEIRNEKNVKNVTVTHPGRYLLVPEQTASVEVTYTPVGTDDFSFEVVDSIQNAAEKTYALRITGRAVAYAPIMTVSRNGNQIANGAQDFQGTVKVNEKQTLTYTIKNQGNIDLNLKKVQILHQANATAAVIKSPKAIAVGQSGDVKVSYTPTTTFPLGPDISDVFAFDLRFDTNEADATPYVIGIDGTIPTT